MKFLIHGNSPTVATGYGIQIGQLAKLLIADGHEVAVSATYGIQSGVTSWNDIRVYGCGYDINSDDRLHMHAEHWFRGEPGWIITVVDVWAIKNPLLPEFNVLAWTPVDHITATGPQDNVVEFFHRSKATPVAMSQFGEKLLLRAGLDPAYIPLSVDTSVYKPTPVLSNGMTARAIHELPEDAFVVGMVGMNKGWARDRKGFNEAFWAFSMFEQDHPDAYLYVHADAPGGAEGIDLKALAREAGIPPQKLRFAGGPNQYGYYLTYTPEMMAATYTSFDVLLAPSHGEGFCVPLIEAHACGTPTIATDFSAQTELVVAGTGWLVAGQPEFDPAHRALYKCPSIPAVIEALEAAYDADREEMADLCILHAADYDVQFVYDNYWKPFLATLEPAQDDTLREPIDGDHDVAVLCPVYRRTKNLPGLIESFLETTLAATLYLIVDDEDIDDVQFVVDRTASHQVKMLAAERGSSFAQKLNAGFDQTTEPWILCIGDDVIFHEGWLDAARKVSDRADVIGTNDSLPGRIRNPKVANGTHADHFFVRRNYIVEHGASLDGEGVLACEDYKHWFVDAEIVRLARARGVFIPCLDSVVEHLHPGYDGREDLREADPTYMAAVKFSEDDAATFESRLPMIEMQRRTRAHV